MLMFYGSSLMVFVGLTVYCSTREHLLTTLLSLEFMVLGVFCTLILSLSYGVMFYSLFYLIITACEGALGLSILVAMSRAQGGDYFKSLNFSLS